MHINPMLRRITAALQQTRRPVYPTIVSVQELPTLIRLVSECGGQYLFMPTQPDRARAIVVTTCPACNDPNCCAEKNHPPRRASTFARILRAYVRKYGTRGLAWSDGFAAALAPDDRPPPP